MTLKVKIKVTKNFYKFDFLAYGSKQFSLPLILISGHLVHQDLQQRIKNIHFLLTSEVNISKPVASGIQSVIQGTQYATLNLLKRCIYSSALCSSFYLHLLYGQRKGCTKSLLVRTLDICDELNIYFTRYMLHAPYARGVNLGMNCFIPHGVNGTVDSLRYMFNNYSHDNRNTVKMLLRSYM